MSNYSDFFGVGSSGGGGGIPINSYTPFLVSSTGVPPGYDATTGLYTHPDGSFWVRSGLVLSGVATTYPNATSSPFIATGRTIPGAAFSTNVQAQYVTSDLIYTKTAANFSMNYTEYSFATGAATGKTFVDTGAGAFNGSLMGNVYDSANDILWIGHWTWLQFNGTMTWSAFTFSTGAFLNRYLTTNMGPGLNCANAANITGVRGDASQVAVLAGSAGTYQYRIYDFSGGNVAPVDTTGTNNVPAPPQNHAQTAGFGGNIYFSAFLESPTVGRFLDIDNYLDIEFSTANGAGGLTGQLDTNIRGYDIATNNYTKITGTTIEEYGSVVGDGTARTDTDTGQPLFIRIG